MSALDDEYARARPALAARLRALGLDVQYVRGQGDVLTTSDGRAVLDLAGGFGTTLFGHHHPRLVGALRAALDEQRPFSSQLSWRTEAARLSCALSARIATDEGHAPRVLLYSTGAEAVEAAITWALLEHHERVSAGRARLPPVLVCVEGSYHGRSAGAASVSARLAGDLGARALRAEVRACPRNDLATLARWCDELVLEGHSRVAAMIVEPVQGEGGVVVLDDAFLAGVRQLADRHGFLVIADEIQCGLGRTGRFLASSGTGLAPDAVLLGKALGGSLVKLSALAVREDRWVERLPLVATGTFVDDDLTARVGLAALALIDDDDVPGRCARVGAALQARLHELARRHPTVVREVRGRGLMIGVQLGLPNDGRAVPRLMTLLADAGFLAALVAGYLVQRHGVRTAPALSALSVLRMQPSAFLDEPALARAVAALDDALDVLEQGDVARLLAHVSGEEPPARPAVASTITRAPPRASDARVAFLAPLAVAGDVRHLEPALADLSEAACERLLERTGPLLPPFVADEARVVSATGSAVTLTVVGVPVTAAQAMAALRAGRPQHLIDVVRAAASLGVDAGARVVGFGGHTSIVGQLYDSWSIDVAWVSGNALTAAAAAEVARAGARRRGLPLRVGVLGGAGSIGALVAELVAPDADEVVLVGRERTQARLEAVARRALGATRWRVSTEARDLAACSVIVAASNAPEPVLRAAHVGRPVLIVDVAVPGDAHPELHGLEGVTVVRGGAVRLPLGATLGIAGLDVGGGHVHACLAETLVCGLGALYDTSLSGSPTAARARRLLELAREHGFVIDEAAR